MSDRATDHPLSAWRAKCEYNAWDSLARYKYSQFGYWAAHWKVANDLCGQLGLGKVKTPFGGLVKAAQARGFGVKAQSSQKRNAKRPSKSAAQPELLR